MQNRGLVPMPAAEVRRYSGEARREFRTGDVLFFRGKGPVSSTIRWLTKSPYSHVGLVYLFDERVFCLEAIGSGVRLALVSEVVRRYDGRVDYYEVLDASEEQRRKVVGFGFAQLGKLYDRAGIWRFFWSILSGRMDKVRRDHQWFCSELVAAAYVDAGLSLCDRREEFTSPGDLAGSAKLRRKFRLKR
jgi:uncharacterized protein YycO